MLKQSLYLYDNNVTVYFSPETGGFVTNRSSKVYDRKLNFFKGIDNTVLFSFKNDEYLNGFCSQSFLFRSLTHLSAILKKENSFHC